MLYSCASRAASRAPRGFAEPPTISGGCGCCTGFGWRARVVRPGVDDRVRVVLELVETLADGRKVEAVRLVLRLVPAGADPDLDPTAGDMVCGDGHPGDDGRMAERDR